MPVIMMTLIPALLQLLIDLETSALGGSMSVMKPTKIKLNLPLVCAWALIEDTCAGIGAGA